ncbi:MAG TPA: EF-hand domain-containing protein [Devosia sp.]|nr:EF-hand domain-containing protein [Devosia sp.]
MTSVGSGGAVGAGLLNRLFQLVDKDKSSTVSGDELSAVLDSIGQGQKSSAILATHDSDGDGALSATEWHDKLVSDENLGQLLSLQDLRDMKLLSPAERQQQADTLKQEYFSRVDADDNGVLSGDEVEADRVLNLARVLDGGALPNSLVMFRPGADRNALTLDDITVGQRIDPTMLKVTEPSAELKARIATMRARMAQMQDGSDTATETAAADNQPLTVEGQTEKVKTASLSHALITRLIAQFSTQGTAGTAASTDFSA